MAKILVVDDSFAVRQGLQALLVGEGHSVIVAWDGEDGLTAARKFKPDLIVTDLAMPNLDGLGMVRQLRQEKVVIPVLMMSLSAEEKMIKSALDAGVTEFLDKVTPTKKILAAVARLLVPVASVPAGKEA